MTFCAFSLRKSGNDGRSVPERRIRSDHLSFPPYGAAVGGAVRRGPAAVAPPSRAGMRVVASDGAGHACSAVAAAGVLLVRRFPAVMAVCRLKRKVRRPADIRSSRFVVRMRSAGSALYFGMSCLHGMCVGRLHAVGRVVPMRSFFGNPFRMAFSKRFYGDAAWKKRGR